MIDPVLAAGYRCRPATAADVPAIHPARARVNRRSEVDVHPDHRGRGLGTALRETFGPAASPVVLDGGELAGVALSLDHAAARCGRTRRRGRCRCTSGSA
jgi:GNAT superfamily N-acetyltransferase